MSVIETSFNQFCVAVGFIEGVLAVNVMKHFFIITDQEAK
jgi:hypothetical protein